MAPKASESPSLSPENPTFSIEKVLSLLGDLFKNPANKKMVEDLFPSLPDIVRRQQASHASKNNTNNIL